MAGLEDVTPRVAFFFLMAAAIVILLIKTAVLAWEGTINLP